MNKMQRDCHLQTINEHGRMVWQKSTGYNRRARAEAAIGRYKRVIGDALRSRTDRNEAVEVVIAAGVFNRRLELGRPNYVRMRPSQAWGKDGRARSDSREPGLK